MLRSLTRVLCLVLATACTTEPSEPSELDGDGEFVEALSPALTGSYTRKASSPNRVSVYDAKGTWLATFTNGARTVRVRGPYRTFAEPSTTAATVRHHNWVRLLDAPFTGTVDYTWLDAALEDTSPDILGIAMQYIAGAPPITSGGLTIAGDAHFGALVNGYRDSGSDFYDYLGISWKYPTKTVVTPDPTQLGSLDCSGFQRMVWGYRGGITLAINPTADRSVLPRKSHDIYASGPGVMVIPNNGTQATDFSKLAVGDVVFHDADTSDGADIDHSGLFLGVDSQGHYRYVSSRRNPDGPTMGDYKGPSILDGDMLFGRSFRAARRF